MVSTERPETSVNGVAPLAIGSALSALGAVGVIAWATVARSHSALAFLAWVMLTVVAVTTGLRVMVGTRRASRRPDLRMWRRVATLGIVVGIGCATLGLAVYSASRTNDCPVDGPCLIPQSGPGQRPQRP